MQTDPDANGPPALSTASGFDFDDASVNARARAVLAGCAGGPETSCHGVGAGHLQLPDPKDAPNLVNVPASGSPTHMRIVPGKPEESYLIWKVRGEADAGIAGDPMPLGSAPLAPKYARALVEWIEAGAL